MNPLQTKRALKNSGRKATPQRLAILAAIEGMKSTFTPQELYSGLQKSHPEIGLVTVYRTLKFLADGGMVCRMERGGKAQTYARRTEEHHHHLVCTACNKVVDVSSCGLAELEQRLSAETGFEISDHRLEFEGVCRQCRGSGK